MYSNIEKYIEKNKKNMVCKICMKEAVFAYLPNIRAKESQLYWLCGECSENKNFSIKSKAVRVFAMTGIKTVIDELQAILTETRKSLEETEDKILSPANLFLERKSVTSLNSLVKENGHKRKSENLVDQKNRKKRTKNHSLEKSDSDLKTDKSRKKTYTFVPQKSTSEINNTNKKGETRLHKLCSSGHIDEIRRCLSEGANPNVRDYTGETPLSEAVRRNALPVVKLLLDAGACVNIPAWKLGTPLMDAVHNDNLEMAKLLLTCGADVNARAVNNITAMSCVKSKNMEELLKTTVSLPTVIPKIPQNEVILTCFDLDSIQIQNTLNLCKMLNIGFYEDMSEVCYTHWTKVSHLIVKDTGSKNIIPSDYALKAFAVGAAIVDYQWVLSSIQSKELVNLEKFEIHGTIEYPDTCAPKKSRMDRELLMPRVFERCNMAFTKDFRQESSISKQNLQELITLSGAQFLKREPDPDSSYLEDTVMVHIRNPNSPLYYTTHIILYSDGKNQELKYKMKHVKSLPVSWFLKCLQTYTIHDNIDHYYV